MRTKEPVALGALVRAVAILTAMFGFELTPEQLGAVILLLEAGLGWWTRARVSPVP